MLGPASHRIWGGPPPTPPPLRRRDLLRVTALDPAPTLGVYSNIHGPLQDVVSSLSRHRSYIFDLNFRFFSLFLRLPVRAALLVPPVGCMRPGHYHGGNGGLRAARWGKFPSRELGGTPVQEDFSAV